MNMTHPKSTPRIIRVVTLCLYLAIVLWLGISVVTSGYHYVLDHDELWHAHMAYLLTTGIVPYVDVYSSVYTPVFHVFMLPVLWLFGFGVSSISYVRVVMIILFLLRIAALAYMAKRLVGKWVMVAVIPLLLLDPFTVFAGMQLRPDNLVLVVYTLGLAALVRALETRQAKWWMITGVLWGLAVVVFVKISVFVGLPVFMLVVYLAQSRQWRNVRGLTGGLITPVALFALYCVVQGSLAQMVQQTLVDPLRVFGSLQYPVAYGSFYRPDNLYIYGAAGKPLSWVYAQVFPWLGFAGAALCAFLVMRKKKRSVADGVHLIMITSLVVYQAMLMGFIQSVFIQYYLYLSWLYAYFGAFGLSYVLVFVSRRREFLAITVAVLMLAFGIFAEGSVRANLNRATITNENQLPWLFEALRIVPPGERVFPELLFHPLTHPLLLSYFMGTYDQWPEIAKRYPGVEQALEDKRVRYLLLSDWDLGRILPSARAYVEVNYHRPQEGNILWLRK